MQAASCRQACFKGATRHTGLRRNLQARACDRSKGVFCSWTDQQEAFFPYIWLRDACRSASSVHSSSKQKLFRTSDISSNIAPSKIDVQDNGLEILWNSAISKDDSQKSFFDAGFLKGFASQRLFEAYQRTPDIQPKPWKADFLNDNLDVIPYSPRLSTSQRKQATQNLQQYGIVLFQNVPVENTSETECELVHLANQIGNVRQTWYGTTFDVKSIKSAKNIAYTNLQLGLHEDLVHFDDPPRYQMLHYLYSHPTLQGGRSRFVDAYAVAEELRIRHPEAFQVLAEMPVAFEYKNDGHWRYAERRTIDIDEQGRLLAVNYSPPFQGPLPLHRLGAEGVHKLYSALQLFARLTDDPAFILDVQLNVGECVAFDNRRVLHARTAFNWSADPNEGDGGLGRHLKGIYMDGDSVREIYRLLAEADDGNQPKTAG